MTDLSAAEKGLERGVVGGLAWVGVMRFVRGDVAEDEDEVFIARLMAAIAAALAAEVGLGRFPWAGDEVGALELEEVGNLAQEWSFGKRCAGQNWSLHFWAGKVSPIVGIVRIITGRTSQRMGAKRTLPHFGRAHRGVEEDFFLPVRTEQSVSKCLSMRMLGSSPAGMAIGTLQNGPEKRVCSLSRRKPSKMERYTQSGATLLCLCSSNLSQLCP